MHVDSVAELFVGYVDAGLPQLMDAHVFWISRRIELCQLAGGVWSYCQWSHLL